MPWTMGSQNPYRSTSFCPLASHALTLDNLRYPSLFTTVLYLRQTKEHYVGAGGCVQYVHGDILAV